MKNARDVINHLELLVSALEGVYSDAYTDELIGHIAACLDLPDFERFLETHPRELVQSAVMAAYLENILANQRKRVH